MAAQRQHKQDSRPGLAEFLRFARTKNFWINIGLILVFFLACFWLTMVWLRSYTKHGQKLELPDYRGYQLSTAREDAEERSFRIHVTDSIHIVDKPGGEIIEQTPAPFSRVKERRTIYVTISKTQADQVSLSRLPELYGKDFSRKAKELENAFQIKSVIVSKRFDPGMADQILAVIYEGDTIVDAYRYKEQVMINKGATLEFIISEETGGRMPTPDLNCKTLVEVRFLLDNLGLHIGEIILDGNVGDQENAWVNGQSPAPSDGHITMGQAINLTISQEKPRFCDE